MSPEEINKMTGADNYNRPQLTKRKSIRIDGKKGGLIITYLNEPKDEFEGYRQEIINEPINVVFLKIRRRLMQGSKDQGIVKYTNEHDDINDSVSLFIKDGEKTEGPAKYLRELHPELKTEQIIYVRYKGEICKLSAKGLSLRGSDNTTNFYQYISNNRDWYKFQTKIVPTQGDEYHFIDFQRGNDLSEEQLAEVIKDIQEVYENCKEVDEAYSPKKEDKKIESESVTPTVGDTGVEYPTEEDEGIKPSDTPF